MIDYAEKIMFAPKVYLAVFLLLLMLSIEKCALEKADHIDVLILLLHFFRIETGHEKEN